MRHISLFVLLGTVLSLASCSREQASEPKLVLFIENGYKDSPEIRVTVDESVIFDGVAQPTSMRPAVIFEKRLDLSPGQHTIRFEDRTRGITESKTFDSSATRTIRVGIQKHVLINEHIGVYEEVIHPK